MAGLPSSSTNSGAGVDPYVLEYAVNMRWLLWYASSLLDPTVEERYPGFIQAAAKMNPIMTRLTFETGCTLGDLPFGVLRLSREAVLYLLVSDHLLGGCPPTMHAFLERAMAASVVRRSRMEVPSHSSSPQSSPKPARKRVVHPDLNVSFPSADTDVDTDDDNDAAAGVRSAAGELASSVRRRDAQPLAAIDPASDEMAVLADADVMHSAVQAMLLLLRWLFSEGIVAEEELMATLELDGVGAGDTHPEKRSTLQCKQFRHHRHLALQLAKLVPFFLGAHLLLTRSLLLQYCATLLTCEGVMAHVTQLLSALPPQQQQRHSAVPPTSVEGALLEWFQAVMDSIRFSEDGAAMLARLRACEPLKAFVQHGPFCAHAMEPADRDFFRLVQSGECVCIALLFYYPDTLPLAGLATALREGAAYFEESLGDATDAQDARDGQQQHQSLCYWTAAAAAARQLGVSLLLSPGEVVAYGRTALPLHLFRFVQQLFAVLATNAEEDVRVSADTAWWELMRSADGLSARMRSAADGAGVTGTATTVPSSSSFSGAREVLRRSLSGAFPLSALVRQSYPALESEAEQVRMGSARGGPQTDDRDEVQHAGAAADTAAVGGGHASQEVFRSLASGTDGASTVHRAGFRADMDSDEAGTQTEFSIKVARTQRDVRRGHCPVGDATVETATSVLRPMVGGRNRSRTSAASSASATAVTASVDSLAKLTTESRQATHTTAHAPTSQRTTELGTYAVDTYLRADEEAVQGRKGSVMHSHGGSSAHVRSGASTIEPLAPTAVETLLHAREAEAALPEMAAWAPAAHTEHETSSTLQTALVDDAADAPLERARDFIAVDDSCAPATNEMPVTANTARSPSPSATSSLTQSIDFVVRRVAPALEATAENASGFAEVTPRRGDPVDEVQTPPDAPTAATGAEDDVEERTAGVHAAFQTALLQVSESGTVAAASRPVPEVRRFVALGTAEEDTDDDADDTAVRRRGSEDSSFFSSASATASSTSTSARAKSLEYPTRATMKAGDTAQTPPLQERTAVRSDPEVLSPSTPGSACRGSLRSGGASSGSPNVADIAVEDVEASPVAEALSEAEKPEVRTTAPRSSAAASGSWRRVPPADDVRSRESQEASRKPQLAAGTKVSEVRWMLPQQLDACTDEPPVAPDAAAEEARALRSRVLLPSPVRHDSPSHRVRRHPGPASPLGDLTVRGSSGSGAVTPLTPALTLSVSEVYGSDYASLLDGVATSEVDLLRRRHRLGDDEESWYSSASRAYPSSRRSPAASTGSAPSAVQATAQVRDLVERLGRVDLAELAHKGKQDLFDALAQQQAVVDQLKAALRVGRQRQATRRGFSYSPSLRPVLERRRQVKVETPRHNSTGKAAASELRDCLGASVLPRQANELPSSTTSAVASGARRRSVSVMTVESAISAAHTLQSDVGGQLAETDVSSVRYAGSTSESTESMSPFT